MNRYAINNDLKAQGRVDSGLGGSNLFDTLLENQRKIDLHGMLYFKQSVLVYNSIIFSMWIAIFAALRKRI